MFSKAVVEAELRRNSRRVYAHADATSEPGVLGDGVVGLGAVRLRGVEDLDVVVAERLARGVVEELRLADPARTQHLRVGEAGAQRDLLSSATAKAPRGRCRCRPGRSSVTCAACRRPSAGGRRSRRRSPGARRPRRDRARRRRPRWCFARRRRRPSTTHHLRRPPRRRQSCTSRKNPVPRRRKRVSCSSGSSTSSTSPARKGTYRRTAARQRRSARRGPRRPRACT